MAGELFPQPSGDDWKRAGGGMNSDIKPWGVFLHVFEVSLIIVNQGGCEGGGDEEICTLCNSGRMEETHVQTQLDLCAAATRDISPRPCSIIVKLSSRTIFWCVFFLLFLLLKWLKCASASCEKE